MSRYELADAPAIAFIGAGAMGGSIIRGLLAADPTLGGRIRITGQWTEDMQSLTEGHGVTGFDVTTDSEANSKAVQGAGVVLIALKPDIVPAVVAEISGALDDGALIISIAAGITTETIEALVPPTVSVVRVMPNTPALVRRGVAGICAGKRATPSDLALAEALFRTVGTVLTVPEYQIDDVTSISGSGPAYVLYLIEELTAVAEGKGFTPEQAALLVHGTFAGTCDLLENSDKSPRNLRRLVTSPNGTTAAALDVLEEGGLRGLFERATFAAARRAKELAH